MDDDEFPLPSDDSDFFDEPVPQPASLTRATIRDGKITLTPWQPSLADSGPMSRFLREREQAGVAIADLRDERDAAGKRELIVEFMAAGARRAEVESTLAAWATDVGFDRVWFPNGPVDLERGAVGLGTASVTCPTCGAEWIDASPAFWFAVADMGHFPTACSVCGNTLPQWTVVDGDLTGCRGDAVASPRTRA